MTVFICNIMGTPRSARINRKIAGKLSIFRDFYSEPLMQETFFFDDIKLVLIGMYDYFSIVITL